LTRSRQEHGCKVCGSVIPADTWCYTITQLGGGLGSLKFPDRVHADELPAYWDMLAKREDGEMEIVKQEGV
jgi:hypothetical protein